MAKVQSDDSPDGLPTFAMADIVNTWIGSIDKYDWHSFSQRR